MPDAPKTVADAVAAELPVVLTLPKTEPGSAFDAAMRATLARIEKALK